MQYNRQKKVSALWRVRSALAADPSHPIDVARIESAGLSQVQLTAASADERTGRRSGGRLRAASRCAETLPYS